MQTKIISLCVALLMGGSVWADVLNCNVYENCSQNGDTIDISTHGIENGHEWIDLGLPSGLKWALCNVGASEPEDYGNYYAWGEVLPKEDYWLDSYKYNYYSTENSLALTKYCYDSTSGKNGFTDKKTTLDLCDDAARVNWGGKWRMPTDSEIGELLMYCTFTWTTKNGVNGYQVTSKRNNNSIFLPAAGYHIHNSNGGLVGVGNKGRYWSSTLDNSWTWCAYYLYFTSSTYYRGSMDYGRYMGCPVRPVCP